MTSGSRHGREQAEIIAGVVGTVARYVAVILPLLMTLDRLRRPFGEKFLFANGEGSADLGLPFKGAAAILRHIDPYGPLPPDLQDPWPPSYPPTMLLLYVPLVWVTNANILLAYQIFYWMNLAALGILTFVVWRLSKTSFVALLIAFTLNVQTMFALERGQVEIMTAALLWASVLLFVRRRQALAMAAATTAAAIKGYGVPVALGLLLAARDKRSFFRGLAAAAGVSLLLTVPAAPYLRQGFRSMLMRTDYLFLSVWWNHSFKNAFYTLVPSFADRGRLVMIAVGSAVAAASLFRLIVAVRRGTEAEVKLRAVLFTTAAAALMIGIPVYTGPYNYLLILPGAVFIALRFLDVSRILDLNRGAALSLGLGLISLLAFAFWARWRESEAPLAGFGLIILIVCCGAFSCFRGTGRADGASTSHVA